MVVSDKLKQLNQGSECPLFEGNMLTLYSVRFSPFAERVRLVLNYKEIPFNIVNVNIRNKPDWFLKKNPLGKVPTLEESDGTILYESLIVAEYLDSKYPGERPLLPADPYERAVQKQLVEAVIQTAAYKHTLLDGDSDAKQTVATGLDAVESLLISPFWAGDQIGFADIMLWPWFERMPAISHISGLEFSVDKYPKLLAWMARMLSIPSVKGTAYTTEERITFLETRKNGAINFDAGLQ